MQARFHAGSHLLPGSRLIGVHAAKHAVLGLNRPISADHPRRPRNALPSLLSAAAQPGSVDILRRVSPLVGEVAHGEALRIAVMAGRRQCVDYLGPMADADHIASVPARQRFGCVDTLAAHLSPAALVQVVAAMPASYLPDIRERLRVHQAAGALEETTPATPQRRSGARL